MFLYRLLLIFLGWGFFLYSYSASHHPQEFLESIKGQPDEGKQIVEHFCANCHAVKPLIAIGAPRIEQKEDWEIRLSQGIRRLFQHTEEGLNAMPPRGGCFECSDEQLMLAIEAMLPPDLKRKFILNKKNIK
ncbi:c-type cytochrome [Legionella clemsonensis]|uniref:Cytochrome c5 n=1 Tax=Legionella clemsonensis TaxID=1867846 RepID=A0A222P2P7_9GAMM|nr:c-type cytochrome [Legionella clemsonensis]ASQ46116.1 Cytochrome c5 [Legionella clemsonensis]